MSAKAHEPRFAVPASGFIDKLSKFMSDQYKNLMAEASHGKNPDVVELLDVVFAMLPISTDETMGFISAQIEHVMAAANDVCENWQTKIPSHRVLICDRRYVRIDTQQAYYDVLTNKVGSNGPGFMPVEVVSYSIGAVYARIIRQRQTKEAGKSAVR